MITEIKEVKHKRLVAELSEQEVAIIEACLFHCGPRDIEKRINVSYEDILNLFESFSGRLRAMKGEP